MSRFPSGVFLRVGDPDPGHAQLVPMNEISQAHAVELLRESWASEAEYTEAVTAACLERLLSLDNAATMTRLAKGAAAWWWAKERRQQ